MRSHRAQSSAEMITWTCEVPIPHGLVLCLFVPDGKDEETSLDMELVERQKAIFNAIHLGLSSDCHLIVI